MKSFSMCIGSVYPAEVHMHVSNKDAAIGQALEYSRTLMLLLVKSHNDYYRYFLPAQ